MKLLYFVQHFPPEQASGLSLVMELLEGFAQHGWDVDVYTSTPTRGVSNKERKLYRKKKTESLFDGKVTVHRMPLYREGTGFVQRTIRYCFFSLQCLIKGLFKPADMIFTGGGPPTQGVIAGLIHKWTKKKVVYNPQDLFPDSMIYAGLMHESSLAVRFWRKLERFSYKNADLIITISEDMKQTILNRCDLPEKVHVVRNWIDTDRIVPIQRNDNILFDTWNLSRDAFYVTYAGNLGMMQGVNTILEAAGELKEYADIHFLIIGNGSEEQRIRNIIQQENRSNVSWYPLQASERISEVYSLGDLSIVSCKPGTGKVGMPSKTWSIMAAGTGIIASFDCGGEMERILQEAACGMCTEAGDATALAEAIRFYYQNRNKTVECGMNARQYAVTAVAKAAAIDAYVQKMENCYLN